MVRTHPTTLITARLAGIRRRHGPHVRRQRRIDIICVDRNHAAGRVPRHVLVDHGQNTLCAGLVTLEDFAGPQHPALLARVEVELERVFRLELRGREDAERFEDDHHARAVVDCAGAAGRGVAAGGVEVGTYNDCVTEQRLGVGLLRWVGGRGGSTEIGAGAGNSGDDGGLVEFGVREL